MSIGSAIALGLKKGRLDAAPTTIYLLLGEHCVANCTFCAQARTSNADRRLLSRVVWPEFELAEILSSLHEGIQRLCIQTLKYPQLMNELLCLVQALTHAYPRASISACINPVSKRALRRLKDAGVERIGLGLDCAEEQLFAGIKPGVGTWQEYMRGLKGALDVFPNDVTVHLITGLGESDDTLLHLIQRLHDSGVVTALFALTPIKGTALESTRPSVARYRAIQLARHLLINDLAKVNDMRFEAGKLCSFGVPSAVVDKALSSGAAFRTSGCKLCNRPFYNERAGGVIYNYPRALTPPERDEARAQLQSYGL